MNILLLTITYPPEVRAISLMIEELASQLHRLGHRVTVAAAWPTYNVSAKTDATALREFSEENGINVIRIKTLPGYRRSFFIRGLAQLLMPSVFERKIARYLDRSVDAVIAYSPALSIGLLGKKLKEKFGCRYLLNIQDIFPQNAIDLGILKNKLLIRFYERMEHDVYRSADRISTHTDSSTKFLIENKGVPAGKITTVYNWIDFKAYESVKPAQAFRKKMGLEGKFVYLFSGIIGPSQGLDFLLQVASRVADIPAIRFALVGDGSEKEKLSRTVKKKKIKNVMFFPYVSLEEYPFLVKEMDAGVACLSMKNKTPVIPGKILGFMAGGIPTIAFLNKESDGHALIASAQAGFSCCSDDLDTAVSLVKKIYNEREINSFYGNNGMRHVKQFYAKDVSIRSIVSLLE